MDFSAARIAGLEAELAALRGGAPASEGGGVQGPLAAPTPSNALAQALQVPGQGQVADNYLRPDKFVSSCAHFGRHHPRGGNAQRAEPQELSPHDLAQSSAAYQQALATNKNEEARVLLTAISGALYFEVGAVGLADCLRSRDKLVASARATKASVDATFPEGGDVDEDGITDEERVQRASYIEVRRGVIEALGKLEEVLIGFFGGLPRWNA